MAEEPESGEHPRRRETPDERADRNWLELLQELRVLQTGTQILTGFLLALAFQPAFADLEPGQKAVYLALIGLSGLSAVIALAPVAAHRMLFRLGEKAAIVTTGHVCLIVALAIVSLLLAGVVGFVFDVVVGEPAGWIVGEPAGWIAGGTLAAAAVLGWGITPVAIRARRE